MNGGSYSETTIREVAIPTGETGLSDVVDIEGYTHAVILVPADWVTATSVTFQAAASSGGTFYDVYDDQGNEMTVTVAASRAVALVYAPISLPAARYIKLRSGTTASAVDQTNSPTLVMLLKG